MTSNPWLILDNFKAAMSKILGGLHHILDFPEKVIPENNESV